MSCINCLEGISALVAQTDETAYQPWVKMKSLTGNERQAEASTSKIKA